MTVGVRLNYAQDRAGDTVLAREIPLFNEATGDPFNVDADTIVFYLYKEKSETIVIQQAVTAIDNVITVPSFTAPDAGCYDYFIRFTNPAGELQTYIYGGLSVV